MASGVQAGRLSIEIVAEIARLQQDLDKAKRAVRDMSNDIARNSRAANDNLARMGSGFEQTGRRMVATAGSTRMGLLQLSYQIGDVSQQMALGVPASRIWIQQSGQVLQAVQLLAGGTSRFVAFLQGPWGIALTFAVVALAPLAAKLFETDEAMKKVEFSSYQLKDAQGILGNVFDLTTGKINTQKEALLALAKAQIIAGQVQARSEMASSRSAMGKMAAGPRMGGLFPGSFLLRDKSRRGAAGDVVDAFLSGDINTKEAVSGLESLNKTGMITEKVMLDAMKAVTDFGVASENLKVFQDAEKALGGDKGALAQFLNPSKSKNSKAGAKGPSAEQIEKQFTDQLQGYVNQSLSAQQQLTTSIEDRAELEMREVEWTRRRQLADIAAQKNFSETQKDILNQAVESLADYQRQVVEFHKRAALEKQAQEVENARYQASLEGLQAQASIANSERERKDLSLQIFDAEQKYLQAKLEAVIHSQTAADAEKELAQIELNALNDTMSARREGVARQNETSVEKYIRDISKTRDQMNEAIDQIKMDGLDALNEGIVDAIVNFKSLGDVVTNVTRQILAELLKLEIQKFIIAPFANALGLGTASVGAPVNLLAATPFDGGRASGGPVAAGTSYLIGEHGPELLTMGSNGYITSNDRIATNDNGAVRLEIADTTDLFRFRVNGQILEATPGIAEVSTRVTGAKASWHQSRRIE